MYLGRRTTTELDHYMTEVDNKKFSVVVWFSLKLLSTIHEVVHVIKSNYSVTHFCNASA